MSKFLISYTYNDDIIKRLAKMQMNLFCRKFQITVICIGVICIYLGIFIASTDVTRMLLFGCGCYLFTMQWYPSWEQSKKMKKLFGKEYPQCRLDFGNDRIEAVALEKRNICYDEISGLYITGKDMFLLTEDKVLLCVPKDSVEDRIRFEDFIGDVTGLEWIKQKGVFNTGLFRKAKIYQEF